MWLRKSCGLRPQVNLAASGSEYGFLWRQGCCCLRQQPTVAASGRKSNGLSQWATQKYGQLRYQISRQPVCNYRPMGRKETTTFVKIMCHISLYDSWNQQHNNERLLSVWMYVEHQRNCDISHQLMFNVYLLKFCKCSILQFKEIIYLWNINSHYLTCALSCISLSFKISPELDIVCEFN